MIDCPDVAELLDAYALGAADKPEADAIERHVADCVHCWEELRQAQRAAASLALSAPMEDAPPRLEGRIMREAEREKPRAMSGAGWLERLRLSRPVLAAGALGFAGVVAVVLAAVQVQMSDLRDSSDALEKRVADAGTELRHQEQINAVLAASDTQQIPMTAMTVGLTAAAACAYNWSAGQRAGFVACSNLPQPPEGRVYNAWLTERYEATLLGDCSPRDGYCQFPVDLSRITVRADGIGISTEPAGGSAEPTGGWLMYASFNKQ